MILLSNASAATLLVACCYSIGVIIVLEELSD